MVEDVHYLKKHSIKESYMFFVDSNNRDKIMFPHPNEYAVQFSAPFKHVYSMEILDASIPRTQYAVDVHNNTLSYILFPDTNDRIFNTVTIPVGDYTDKNLIVAINTILSEQSDNNGMKIRNLSTPAEERSTFVLESVNTFVLNTNTSTLSTVLGFNMLSNEGDVANNLYSKFELNTIENAPTPPTVPTKPLRADYDTPNGNFDTGSYNTALSTYRLEYDIYESELASYTINLNEYKTREKGYFKSILSNSVEVHNEYVGPLNVGISHGLDNKNDSLIQQIKIQNGNFFESLEVFHLNFIESAELGIALYDSQLQEYQLNTQETKINIIKHTSSTLLEFSTKTYIDAGIYYLILYNVSDDTALNLNINSALDDDLKLFNGNLGNLVDTTQTLQQIISEPNNILENSALCVNIKTGTYLNAIQAPGIYSLIGDRYCILRCPEIEQHMFRSRAYEKYTMGLAKFKLAVLGYDESRFDFASLPPREFHPIGKLTQLTFRFERPDGSLYNFRGVNHTITLALRYLTPLQLDAPKNQQYPLNPDYDPDFFRYQQNEESDSYESD